jgi:hypothetical protein
LIFGGKIEYRIVEYADTISTYQLA